MIITYHIFIMKLTFESHIHLVPNLGGPDAALPALPQKGTPKSHG